ncbi:ATP-binding cassette domain-containing protein [Epibacterium sp. SM1979]|uniref:ATP-binding cassette domain-containing protein n=1 Tax=Tritonibacter litoralis TaxID=2662264 RepID=A0A843YDL4_9RHOB|nr:ABC transporter ATP-binding protein [Tritonibacter litoralis]MQQ07159.1 ATP-binding cassette domain-containing protein [Tritonibacter litoralis]
MPILTLKFDNVHKSFVSQGQRRSILNGVSLSLAAGETMALTGESGSGKSTLLHLAAGLDQGDGGNISVCGQNITGLSETGLAELRKNKIAVVFQQFNLIPSLTAWQNIGFHARLAGRFDQEWSDALCEVLGLDDLRNHTPDQLSGGQQQRVAIARAMAVRPALLLADEPTGSLDETSGHKVLDLLLNLVSQEQTALLLVTHSTAIAERLARRVHLSHGQLT